MFFRRRSATRTPVPAPAPPTRAEIDPDVPRYPPFLQGFPPTDPEVLLDGQADLCRRLRNALSIDDADYARHVAPSLRGYAAFVHLLPASETHHHRGAGGLLRHGLEVALYAAQKSRKYVFALDRQPSERYHLEPLWGVAAALAGLLHDIGKPVADLSVSDRDGKVVWSPFTEPLADWLARTGVQRYFLHWRDNRVHGAHEAHGTLVLRHVLSRETEDWLGRDPAILATLVRVIGGQALDSEVGQCVSGADQVSVSRDLRENRIDPDAHALGVPVDRYLIDAMRRLVAKGTWTVNRPGARVWRFAEGLHLVWPQAAEDIYAELANDRVPGIPKSPDTIADILVDRGHVQTYPEDGRERFYHRLAPAALVKEGKPVELTMLRLSSPDLLFRSEPPGIVALWGEPDPTPNTAARVLVGATVQTTAPAPRTESPSDAPADHGARPPERDAARTAHRPPIAAAPRSAGADASDWPDLPDSEDIRGEEAAHAEPVVPARRPAAPPSEPSRTEPPARRQRSQPIVSAAAPASPPTAAPSAVPAPSAPRAPDAVGPRAAQSPVPSDPTARARAWLGRHGAAGAYLLETAPEWTLGDGQDAQVRRVDDLLLLRIPDCLGEDAEAVKDRLRAFNAASLIEIDPRYPLQYRYQFEGATWVRLTTAASAAVGALITAAAPPTPPPVQVAPDTTAPRLRPYGQAQTVLDRIADGSVPTTAVAGGRLLSNEALAAEAQRLGVLAPRLRLLLLYRPICRDRTDGIVVAGDA